MDQNRLEEIRRAYESGDIERTRALIRAALQQKPTPQLYRLAAELAINEGQRAYFLEKGRELEARQRGGPSSKATYGEGTVVSCQYCNALNPAGNMYCSNCGLTLPYKDPPRPVPSPPSRNRTVNKRVMIFGIVILFLCLWAVGLVFVGMVVIRGDVAERISNPALTLTAFAKLGSTPQDPVSQETATVIVSPASTAAPGSPEAPTAVPSSTAEPTIEIPGLEAGRVTTEDYNFYNPAISPDHQAVAAAIEAGDRWQIVEIDPVSGLITREITDQDHIYTNPHYSTDGETILLRANISGYFNVYLVDADTGKVIQTLTDYTGSVAYPRWMPDYQSFLYKRFSNEDAEIFIGYLDGSAPTQLTDNNRYDGSPASSPDGRFIVMSSFIEDNYEIVLLDRDTGTFQQLTYDSGRDSEPVFSPDGRWIAFESDRSGDYNIWAVRTDGTELRQITTSSKNELIPAFSQDGGWLYFQQMQEDGNFSINRVSWP